MAVESTGPAGPTTRLDGELAWAIIALAPNAILLVEADGTISLANHQAEEMFRYDPGGLIGADVDDLVPPALRHAHRGHRQAYAAEPRSRPMGSGLDLHASRRDGSTFPVEIALSPLAHADRSSVVVIIRDISERLEAERQLQEAEQELSVLEDRERIARDLHDTVIQRLFAAGMSLQAVAARCDPEVGAKVGGVIDELDLTIREIRQKIFRLTAHRLERDSLRRQVIDVVSSEEDILGFTPEVRFDGPIESIDETRGDHLLAVVREALSNVARHAQATRAEVDIQVGPRLIVTVVDDGVGIAEDADPGGGMANLRSRAESLGGEVEIGPAEVRGTRVHWWVPARD